MHDRRGGQWGSGSDLHQIPQEPVTELSEDLWAQDPVLSRAEQQRRLREAQHARPARIRLRTGAVAAAVVTLAAWLLVSWLTSGSTPPEDHADAPIQSAATESQTGGASGPAGDGRPRDHPDSPSSPSSPSADDGPAEESEGAAQQVIVHVTGAVEEPGIVELEAGARVHEAVEAAGGAQEEAALEALNLAAEAQDGTLIHVPNAEEAEAAQAGPRGAPGSSSADAQDTGGEAGVGSGAGDSAEEAVVDVNTADAQQLQTLPGIGPAMAERIITHRESEGPFSALEDLAAVSGIGPARLQELEGRVSW